MTYSNFLRKNSLLFFDFTFKSNKPNVVPVCKTPEGISALMKLQIAVKKKHELSKVLDELKLDEPDVINDANQVKTCAELAFWNTVIEHCKKVLHLEGIKIEYDEHEEPNDDDFIDDS